MKKKEIPSIPNMKFDDKVSWFDKLLDWVVYIAVGVALGLCFFGIGYCIIQLLRCL